MFNFEKLSQRFLIAKYEALLCIYILTIYVRWSLLVGHGSDAWLPRRDVVHR